MTKPENKPSKLESKAAQTDAAAREIIERDTRKQDEKTARLRAARLKHEAETPAKTGEAKKRGK